METYVLKMILCSSIFIVFYYLILERKKSHQFKRFYLLFSMLFSMLVPLISMTYGVVEVYSNKSMTIDNQSPIVAQVAHEATFFNAGNIIWSIYILVTIFLLLRFLISLNALRKDIVSGKRIQKGRYQLILKNEETPVHSFWKYIILNQTDYEKGKIDNKILHHEELHILQKHSLDVLFIELLLAVFWFNPALYFYKRAILTNHEFLADEYVLKLFGDVNSYQQLLLSELISERILFTNQFNLSNTKKRIKMMTTPNNKKSKIYNWLTVPVSALLFFAFVEKVPAKKYAAEPNVQKSPVIHTKINKHNEAIPANYGQAVEETAKEDNPSVALAKKELVDSTASEPAIYEEATENLPVEKTEAEFPGGINELRKRIANEFNTANIKLGSLKKTEVKIVIDEHGNVVEVTASGNDEAFNNEAIRTFKKIAGNETLKPATANGKAVKSVFRMPITMNFQ